jgi:hypothetical protein
MDIGERFATPKVGQKRVFRRVGEIDTGKSAREEWSLIALVLLTALKSNPKRYV